MQNDVYRRLGELVAVSVVQGGSGLHVFNSSVYQYLCGADVTTIIPSICQVPDVEVREVLEQVHEHVHVCTLVTTGAGYYPSPFCQFLTQVKAAPDDRTLRKLATDNCALLIESGLTMPLALLTVHDKDTIVQTVALHHVLLKSKAEMDQFAQGLSALGVLDAIKDHSNLFECYFSADGVSTLVAGKYICLVYLVVVSRYSPLSPLAIPSHVHPHYSPSQSI